MDNNDSYSDLIDRLEEELAANERFFFLNYEAGNITPEIIAWFNEKRDSLIENINWLKSM